MNKFIYETFLDQDGKITSIKRIDINGKEVWIPTDPANSDYQIYLESLNDDTETE